MVEQDLPAITSRFGKQLQILYIDVNHPHGETVYQAALEQFGTADQIIPLAIIDQTALHSAQIPSQLPGLVEKCIQQGGIDWPAINGLEMWLSDLPDTMSLPLDAAVCNECDLTATQEAGETTRQPVQSQTATPEPAPGQPIVQAVMFWIDGCSHCEEVMENVLPPIQAKYGEQFQIKLIKVLGGAEVEAMDTLADSKGIVKENLGVPFLIIGEHVLLGANQIPAELPGLIDQYLAEGGVAYPDTPVLAPFLTEQPVMEETCEPYKPCAEGEDETQPAADVAVQQPTQATTQLINRASESGGSNGFALAVATMVAMAAALVFSAIALIQQYRRQTPKETLMQGFYRPWMDWLTLILVLIGVGVAGYLAYVETQMVSAVCGPIGDCNTVQSSSYARLFGILPIGVLGVFGYLAILATWLIKRGTGSRRASLAALAFHGMAFGGVLFSLYLTYLEPFVIKAVCMWCITSAVIMTLLLLLSIEPALQALNYLCGPDGSSVLERKPYVEEKSP